MSGKFALAAPFRPTGDQPEAIEALAAGLAGGRRFQILEGVTGSGKTFTIANVIARYQRPVLVISHNKTLAAQLYGELKGFFPRNAVEYFVSYYDYYQPEAYIPQTDTYIEKDASINEEIERLRLSATSSLIQREDVIVVASVSCIYGLGSPDDHRLMMVEVRRGDAPGRDALLRRLVDIQYSRNDVEPGPGTFRVRGDIVDVFPAYAASGLRLEFCGDEVEAIRRIEPLTGKPVADADGVCISPAKHFVVPPERIDNAIDAILAELGERVQWFERKGKLLEAQRLKMRTMFDVEMLREAGYCAGIENYSRHLEGRAAGVPPSTLLEFFPRPFLTVIDESHVTVPQLRGMFNADRSRKRTLVDFGFRLPSALDNRPLSFEEFRERVDAVVFTTATPGQFETEVSDGHVQQVIRPTGLVDPPVAVRPLRGQIDDLMEEVRRHAEQGQRVLVTTLTKRTAEDLTEYLKAAGLRVQYLHSDIDALRRVKILRALRQANFDCLVGVNLLREGLDLPEVSLVAVLDADKEGFLRSETSLIQVAGRAARHLDGKVILYADERTDSIRNMLAKTRDRRRRQLAYNRAHGITPTGIRKAIDESLFLYEREEEKADARVVREAGVDYDVQNVIADLQREMLEAADALEFERAALLRDQIRELELELIPPAGSRDAKTGRRPGRGKPGRRRG